MSESEKILHERLNTIESKLDKILNLHSESKKIKSFVTAQQLSKHTKWNCSADYDRARREKLVKYKTIKNPDKSTSFRYDLDSIHPDFKL